MWRRKGLLAPQNTFLDHIGARFDGTQSNFLLGSAQVPEIFPIVYCSDGFCSLTGFPRSQIMQRSCSCDFLYGRDTCLEDIGKIHKALLHAKPFQTRITLYRKDETPFLCLLDIVPIKNEGSAVVMFLVSHKEVTKDGSITEEIEERSSSSTSNGINSYHDHCQTGEEPAAGDLYSFDKLSERRRSRAVLYNLSENLKKKEKKGFLSSITRIPCKCTSTYHVTAGRHVIANGHVIMNGQKMFGNSKSSMPEYNFGHAARSSFIIKHSGTAKAVWDWFVVFVTFYVTAVVPYYAAVQSVRQDNLETGNVTSGMQAMPYIHHKLGAGEEFLGVFVEIIFIVDIALTFRTTFVNKNGWIVADPRQIAVNYLRTWFAVDLVAALPVDTISHLFHIDFGAQPVALLKTVRLVRLFRLFHNIDRWSQYSAVVLLMLMVMFLLIAHWLACIWLSIGRSEVRNRKGVGWLYELGATLHLPFFNETEGGPDDTSAYITSLYFTLSSLTSVGFGNVSANTNNEKIFSICVMMIGALMHAVVFGNVTAIIQRMYARRSQYDIKTRDVKDFIKVHRLSKTIKRRMVEHFQRTWGESRGVNPNEIMKEFPREIQADIALHLHKDLFNLPAFQIENEGFRRYLSLHTRRCTVAPGGHVVYVGDPLETVNVVCKGSLEVREEDVLTCILGKGEVFGADVDPDKQVMSSKADVKAMTYCELECISVKGLLGVFDLYPEFATTLMKDLKSDYSCNLWEKAPMLCQPSSCSEDSDCDNSDSSCSIASEGVNETTKLCSTEINELDQPQTSKQKSSGRTTDVEEETSLLEPATRTNSPEIRPCSPVLPKPPAEDLLGHHVIVQVDEAEPPAQSESYLKSEDEGFLKTHLTENGKADESMPIKHNGCKPDVAANKCFDSINSSHKQEKKSKRLITFFRTFSQNFIQPYNEAKERSLRQTSAVSLAPSTGDDNTPRPSCIRKKAPHHSTDRTTRRCRSASEIYSGKRVTFFDMIGDDEGDQAERDRRTRQKSASICASDIKKHVSSASRLETLKSLSEGTGGLGPKRANSKSKTTCKSNDLNLGNESSKRTFSDVFQSEPRKTTTSFTLQVPLLHKPSAISLPNSPLKGAYPLSQRPVGRRRRRTRRKSPSPKASSRVESKKLHLEGCEPHPITTVRDQGIVRSGSSPHLRSESSGSEGLISDSVFNSPSITAMPAFTTRSIELSSLEDQNQNISRCILNKLRELASEVAALRTEFRGRSEDFYRCPSPRLVSSRESLVQEPLSYYCSLKTDDEVGETLQVPLSYSVCSTPTLRSRNLSNDSFTSAVHSDVNDQTDPNQEKGNATSFNSSASSNVPCRPDAAPSVCVTAPSGEPEQVKIDAAGPVSTFNYVSKPRHAHLSAGGRGDRKTPPRDTARTSLDVLHLEGLLSKQQRFVPGNHQATPARDSSVKTKGGLPGWCSRDDDIMRSRDPPSALFANRTYFQFDKKLNHPGWASCTDIDDELLSCKLGVPKIGGCRKGNESGYISTSPTIHMHEDLRT